jgi:hypothetical protein
MIRIQIAVPDIDRMEQAFRQANDRKLRVSAGRNDTRLTGTRSRPDEIESHSQMRSATGSHRAAASGGEPRGDWSRERPLKGETAQLEVR